MKLVRYLVLAGNLLLVLWLILNGIDEGFKGSTAPQIASYIFLFVLLAANSLLVYKSR